MAVGGESDDVQTDEDDINMPFDMVHIIDL